MAIIGLQTFLECRFLRMVLSYGNASTLFHEIVEAILIDALGLSERSLFLKSTEHIQLPVVASQSDRRFAIELKSASESDQSSSG
jgi:hypothetical protein